MPPPLLGATTRMAAPFAAARRLADRGTRRRGALVGTLALGERLLLPAAVATAAAGQGLRALALSVGAAGLLVARGAAARASIARTEAALYRRALEGVLSGDVLAPEPVEEEDARSALFEGMHRVARVLAEGLPTLAANLAAAIALSAVAVASQPASILGAAVGAGLAGGALLFASRRWVDDAQSRARRAWARVVDRVVDAAEGKVELVASGRDATFLRGAEAAVATWDAEARRAARFAGALGRLPVALLGAAVGAAVVADVFASGGAAGDALGRAAVLASFAPAFLGLASGAQELVTHGPRLLLVERATRVAPARSGAAPAPEARAIELREVVASYPGADRPALDGATMRLERGGMTALAGANGCGKTTVLRALLGLVTPSGGEILVDGAPLGSLDVAAWRRAVSFLPQRPYLPARATVGECLRLLDPDLPDATLLEALGRVSLRETLDRLAPRPLDAPVGVLSAGQRQRVAIARALATDARVLLLDEPDAALDDVTARALAAVLVALARDRIVVVAAHGPALLAAASRVIALESGRVTPEA